MTDTRNKSGGRPAKKRIDKQRRVVSTKLTELQYYAVRKRASEAGLRVSEYVRQAVVSAEITPRLNRQDTDILRKLAGEANNINQLIQNHEGYVEFSTSTSWRTGQMPEALRRWRSNW